MSAPVTANAADASSNRFNMGYLQTNYRIADRRFVMSTSTRARDEVTSIEPLAIRTDSGSDGARESRAFHT
jgi:hypothetical protein